MLYPRYTAISPPDLAITNDGSVKSSNVPNSNVTPTRNRIDITINNSVVVMFSFIIIYC